MRPKKWHDWQVSNRRNFICTKGFRLNQPPQASKTVFNSFYRNDLALVQHFTMRGHFVAWQ
jgi:hypothetical protein